MLLLTVTLSMLSKKIRFNVNALPYYTAVRRGMHGRLHEILISNTQTDDITSNTETDDITPYTDTDKSIY